MVQRGRIARVDDITQTTLKSVAEVLKEAGAILYTAFPEALANSRAITERYWAMSKGSGAELVQLLADWDQFRSEMLGFMEGYDIILCPVDAAPAPCVGEARPTLFSHTLPYSLAGWPSVVIRAGTSDMGLPVGGQIVARPWHEHVALAAAAVVEKALPFIT